LHLFHHCCHVHAASASWASHAWHTTGTSHTLHLCHHCCHVHTTSTTGTSHAWHTAHAWWHTTHSTHTWWTTSTSHHVLHHGWIKITHTSWLLLFWFSFIIFINPLRPIYGDHLILDFIFS
jgi:hypothetical protein